MLTPGTDPDVAYALGQWHALRAVAVGNPAAAQVADRIAANAKERYGAAWERAVAHNYPSALYMSLDGTQTPSPRSVTPFSDTEAVFVKAIAARPDSTAPADSLDGDTPVCDEPDEHPSHWIEGNPTPTHAWWCDGHPTRRETPDA